MLTDFGVIEHTKPNYPFELFLCCLTVLLGRFVKEIICLEPIYEMNLFQNTLYDWVRDHRVHHKYSETDADPHNSNRGFFFAHVGWLMLQKHPLVLKKGKAIDMSDVLADPVIQFHQKWVIMFDIQLTTKSINWRFTNTKIILVFSLFSSIKRFASLHTSKNFLSFHFILN